MCLTLTYGQITALNLDSQGLSRLSNLDKLVNLRWASFNDNDISKLEGLDNCLHLEELSLDDNCITSMDGQSTLYPHTVHNGQLIYFNNVILYSDK